MAKKKAGGGAATHAGTNFQNRFAAWAAVQILGEVASALPWDLPASVNLVALQAEAPSDIDDLVLSSSAGGRVMTQAKTHVTLGTTPQSFLGSAVTQFVNQFRNASPPMDASRDRMVLATSAASAAGIRTHLTNFLSRLRSSPNPDNEWTSGNQEEKNAATVLHAHITRAWEGAAGTAPTADEITSISRLIRITALDLGDAGQSTTTAKQLLRTTIVTPPAMADAAWHTLVNTAATYATHHQAADRRALQNVLTTAGINTRAPMSFEADISRLRAHTTSTLHALRDLSMIHVGNDTVSIKRNAIAALSNAAIAGGGVLVIGAPGAGKSGALYELGSQLNTQQRDVVVLAVDQLEAASAGALRQELGLTHDLILILGEWAGNGPAYLIIDALDAARSAAAMDTLEMLIGAVADRATRWTIIASVRRFDVQCDTRLRRLFHGSPPQPAFTDPEFSSIRHLSIPTLSPDEIAQVWAQHSALADLISAAPPSLRELLALPFNLRLLGELLGSGITTAALTPIGTQVELLDRYWRERIIRNDHQSDARELLLRRTTNAMVQARALRVKRVDAIANETAASTILHDLLSNHILAESTTATGKSQREFLTFPHHVLFDYAVARLVIPPEHNQFIQRLQQEPDLFLAIRPSIDLHCQRLWHEDRDALWVLTFALIAASKISEIAKLLPASVIANNVAAIDEIQALLDKLAAADPAEHEHGMVALRHILSTVVSNALNDGIVRGSPWCELLDMITSNVTLPLALAARPTISVLCDHSANLTSKELVYLGRTARRLLSFALTITPNELGLSWVGMNAVVTTATTDPAASIAVLRACITPAQLTRFGYYLIPNIAKYVPTLTEIDSLFVSDLYSIALRHEENSEDGTFIYNSQILPLRSNRKQDYGHGLWQLGEHYLTFLHNAPQAAVSTLLAISEFVALRHQHSNTAVLPVYLDDEQTGMIADLSGL